jgi:nicotinamide-nucleotide amidase
MEAAAERVNNLAQRVHDQLLARGETVATAESLTAGMVGAALTTVPGSSATYRGGLIVYATDLKTQLAGVPAELLAAHGAVAPEVAIALAIGVRERLDATWGLGLTGVAGPDPQDGVAPGTVLLGLAGPIGPPRVNELSLTGDRATIRAAAVRAGLTMIYDSVTERE